jgi:peptidoglycan hydrolase-like protein with peptidoglycan-binding domain
MNLQGRNLSLQSPPIQGDDVKLLQVELQQLGCFVLPDELTAASFGAGTHQAVLDFQTTHGLETTGVVDARTALLINRAVDALHPQPQPSVPMVKGSITDQNARPLTGLIVRAFERGDAE